MTSVTRQEVLVLDSGALQAKCSVAGKPCWTGTPFGQSSGFVAAHDAARLELEEHRRATGHVDGRKRWS